MKSLLKEEIKKAEKIDFKVGVFVFDSLISTRNLKLTSFILFLKCFSPTKWYDSNQRGLKLKEIYADPPLPKPEELEKMAKTYSK